MRRIADKVCCYSIEPYDDYPSFVRRRHFGHLRYDWSRRVFDFTWSCSHRRILFNATVTCPPEEQKRVVAGPAVKHIGVHDVVASMWCPQWPKEAKNWPLRSRKYGWPATAIIHEVVDNGCHVVFAKHPACRNDIHQCRLSFSVAEVILLQSWTQIQQIVYHMLRFFVKRELIEKDCPKDDEVLCTYHLKTLMLWSCEQMLPECWISTSVIEICCNLLQTVVKWLIQKRCPNYFIPDANLFHEHFNQKVVDETVKRLTYFCDSNILSLWFVEHYMRPVVPHMVNERCNDDVWKHVDRYLLHTCDAMKAAEPYSIDIYFSLRFTSVVDEAAQVAKDGTKFSNFSKYMPRIVQVLSDRYAFSPSIEVESCFYFYGTTLRLLPAARLLECRKIQYDSEWFLEVIRQFPSKSKFLRSKHHNFPNPRETGISRSQLLLLEAQDLMENLAGLNDGAEFKILSQMSINMLNKVLECRDSEASSMASASLAYMGGLHFAASEYEIAIGICSTLLKNQTSDQENSKPLNASCLFYIEDIVKVNGFYQIFRQIKYTLKYSKKLILVDMRLTPEALARYLI